MSLDALKAALSAARGTATAGNLVAGTVVGAYGTRMVDYGQELSLSGITNKAQLCLRAVCTAAMSSTTLDHVLTSSIIAYLYDIDTQAGGEDPAIPPEILAGAPSDVLLIALKALRLATNADKKPLSCRGMLNPNAAVLTNGYTTWRGETSELEVIKTVASVKASLAGSPAIEARLAAERLTGRGFTAVGLIVLLVDSVKADQAKKAMTRLFAAYSTELVAVIQLATWLKADRSRHEFAFYTGIPAEYSSKRYEHIAGIAYRALNLSTMQQFGGSFKTVKFPLAVEGLIGEIKEAISDVTIPSYDAEWYTLISETTSLLTSLSTAET